MIYDTASLKGFEAFPAEWTGHELSPYIVENQCFYFLKSGCSPKAHHFFATN
jgi:hypothetical protein